MFEDESDVSGSVQIGNDLDLVLQTIIGELLQFVWRQRIGLNQSRRALVLEMAVQLNDKAVDLEKRRLPHGAFQLAQAFQVVGIVPIDEAQREIRPVHDLAFRIPESPIALSQKLDQSFNSIKQAGRGIGRQANLERRQIDPVGLLGDRIAIPDPAVHDYGVLLYGQANHFSRSGSASHYDPIASS